MRTLEPGLRMSVVDSASRGYVAEQGHNDRFQCLRNPGAGYLVSETTMVGAAVLLSSAPGRALKVLG
jgi:hypothetical protein